MVIEFVVNQNVFVVELVASLAVVVVVVGQVVDDVMLDFDMDYLFVVALVVEHWMDLLVDLDLVMNNKVNFVVD